MIALELAVYSVKASHLDRYSDARHKMRRALATWDGYISGTTFRSLEKDTVFLDYYLWDSLELALRAAEYFKTEPDAEDFLNTIEDLTAHHHFELDSDGLGFAAPEKGDVFEVALGIIDPGKVEKFESIKPELFGLVRMQEGRTN